MWSGELIFTLPFGVLKGFHLQSMRKLSGTPLGQFPDDNLQAVLFKSIG